MSTASIEDQKIPGCGTKEDSVSLHSSLSGQNRSGEASFGPQLLAAGAGLFPLPFSQKIKQNYFKKKE